MRDIIEESRLLESLIGAMRLATVRAESAIDETLAYVDESNKRIAKMEHQAKSNKFRRNSIHDSQNGKTRNGECDSGTTTQ